MHDLIRPLASPPPAYEQSPYMAYPPVAIAPPPAKPRHTGRNFLIAGLIAVVILAALGGVTCGAIAAAGTGVIRAMRRPAADIIRDL